MKKRTKIVCTIGPASESVEILEKMVLAGMDVARLNFSHGSYENHAQLIRNIRLVSKKVGKPILILQDLQGPKIRIGELPSEGIPLCKDQEYVFDTALSKYTNDELIIPIDYAQLHTHVQVGERVLFADGVIEGIVQSINQTQITIKITVSGTLFSHKGLNVPDSQLSIRALTKKDKKDAWFGIEQGVDMIAASFVSSKVDIEELRDHIHQGEKHLNITHKTPIAVLAKIERAAALKNIDEIFDVVDAIMVARGDLGVETPAAEVPVVQKKLIQKALLCAKPIIVATQMLDSMVAAPRATRAEISDVANAVIDHTDAVMLSNESATGEYPLQAVQTLHDTIIATEQSVFDDMITPIEDPQLQLIQQYIKKHPKINAVFLSAKEITRVREYSRQRWEFPVFVFVEEERLLRQIQISWGMFPILVEHLVSVKDMGEQYFPAISKQYEITDHRSVLFVEADNSFTSFKVE